MFSGGQRHSSQFSEASTSVSYQSSVVGKRTRLKSSTDKQPFMFSYQQQASLLPEVSTYIIKSSAPSSRNTNSLEVIIE